jgi:HTH-type transcriptional regulator/antitoxin HigA
MAATLKPARATSPGRILLRELEARGWSQRDLAAIMGRPYQAINQIVRGAKRITPETARELAQAFGTSPELWMNLEVNYRLQLAKQEQKEREIARRSRLYSLAPVAELIRRGQIAGSENVDELEDQVHKYLESRNMPTKRTSQEVTQYDSSSSHR